MASQRMEELNPHAFLVSQTEEADRSVSTTAYKVFKKTLIQSLQANEFTPFARWRFC